MPKILSQLQLEKNKDAYSFFVQNTPFKSSDSVLESGSKKLRLKENITHICHLNVKYMNHLVK